MGSMIEIGIKIRKVVFISIRGVYRSACHHPFLLGFLGFLLFLYRYFPLLFSVLVSASPVLVCTALLLGTLLSFGQPNVPEFEKEERVTHDISSYQAGFSEGETFVSDRDESYFVRGYSEHRSDVEESGVEEDSLVGEKDDRTEEDRGLSYDSALDDENLHESQPKNQVKEDAEREFRSIELGKSTEVHDGNLASEVVSSDDEEAIEKQYVMVQKVDHDSFEIENGKAPGGEFDSIKEGDADCSPSSSWKKVEKENSSDEDNSEDSGSDRAESSSPDASMADIIPMLDELHPLLDLDAPQPAHSSRDGSHAASEKSQKSDDDEDDDDDDDSVESDEDVENHGEADEHGVDEEEEEMEGGKEDESKSAIKWTEDDQKNLLDLGTLELERNRRLENLIARRMARRFMTEKNLIDLDSTDVPSNVAPISVRRNNPFDFPEESYAGMGLPPIPGSAPSILQPRRNPFDIPYDPNEEKPDLKGDSFQQEFTHFNQKEAFFRRHESFNVGPSLFGISKQERHNINWKPVFISERMASEGTSYFQRQSSEVSDSKLSSVPDTESASSGDQDERKFSERELSPETELVSNMDHNSDEADHGSLSSEENESVEMIQAEESNVCRNENEIVLGGVEDPSAMGFYPATGELEIDEQFHDGETHLRGEPSVEVSSSSTRSSQSYRSEVIDDIPDDESEKTANLQHEDGHLPESRISTQTSVEESRISTQSSAEELNFRHMRSEVEDTQLVEVEPVYDSSPPAAEKFISFSSVSSDSAAEFSGTAVPTVSVDTTADVADKESEAHNDRLEDISSGHEETQSASFELHVEVENETRSEKSEDIDQHNVTAEELSAVIPNFADLNGPTIAEFPVNSNFSPDIGSEKGVTDSGLFHEQNIDNHIVADSEMLHQENVESPDSNYQLASEKLHLSDNESVEEDTLPNEASRLDNEDMSVSVQDEDNVLLSSSMEQGNTNIHQDLENNMVSVASDNQHEADVKSPSDMDYHLSSSDKLVDAQSSSNHDENQSSDDIKVEHSSYDIKVEHSQDAGTSKDEIGELHDTLFQTPGIMSSVTSEYSDSPEFRSPTGEADSEIHKRRGEVVNEDQNEARQNLVPSAEGFMSPNSEENINEFEYMNEIDEEFLTELDTVGDFSVGDAGLSHHTDIVHNETRDAQLSSPCEDIKTAEVQQDNDIPVLKERSIEDIDTCFKKLQGVDVNDVILPSTIKDQHVSEESKDHVEINEARSLEDIDVSKDNQGELPDKLDTEDASVKIEANEVGPEKLNESIDV